MPSRPYSKIALMTLGLTLLLPFSSQAIQWLQEDAFILPPEETLAEETWVSALNIDLQGETQESIFFLAKTVSCAGTFKDSVWGAGTLLKFSGHAEDDVRLLSQQTVTLTGTFAKNLMAFAPAVQIISNATVQGDTLLAGKNVVANGTFVGDLQIFSAEAAVGGHIQGDLQVTTGELTFMPGTVIDGNLIYIMPKELFITSGTTLNGELLRNTDKAPAISNTQKWITALVSKAAFYAGAMMVGFVLLSLFPVYTGVSISMAQQHRFRCFWTGMAGFFLMPLIAIFTFASLFGIPLSVLVLCTFAILLYCGKLVTGLAIGTYIIKRNQFSSLWQLFGAMALGTGILYLLFLLPVIGQAIWMTATFTGMGAIMMQLVQGQRRWMTAPPQGSAPQEQETLDDNTPTTNKDN